MPICDIGAGIGAAATEESAGSVYPCIAYTYEANCVDEQCCWIVRCPPCLTSVEIISEFMVQLNFSEDMQRNGALVNQGNYTWEPLGVDGKPVYVRDVFGETPTGSVYGRTQAGLSAEDYPAHVLLETTIHGIRDKYLITVDRDSGIVDEWGRPLGLVSANRPAHRGRAYGNNGSVHLTASARPWLELNLDGTDTSAFRAATAAELALAMGAGGARDQVWRFQSAAVAAGASLVGFFAADEYVEPGNRVTMEAGMGITHDTGATTLGSFGCYDGTKLIMLDPTPTGVRFRGHSTVVPLVWNRFHTLKLVNDSTNFYVRLYVDGASVPALSVAYNTLPDITAADRALLQPMFNLSGQANPGGLLFIPQWPVVAPMGLRQVELDYLYAMVEDVLQCNEAVLIARRTKVDQHDTALARAFSRRKHTTLLQIFSAMGIADDDLGGDFYVERDVPVVG